MDEAVRQSLPIALGVMVSPLPIAAVVLMLVSGNARANALSFLLAWFVSVATVVLVVALGAGSADPDAADAEGTSWVRLGLAAGALLLAFRYWRQRPRPDEEPVTPKWMAAVDSFGILHAAGLAALLAAVNPKNLLLVIAAGARIGTIASGDVAVSVGAAAVFALVGSLGVCVPVALYLGAPRTADSILEKLKRWLIRYNATILCVVFLIIAAALLRDGLG